MESFITRHSDKGNNEVYKGISEAGVEKAKERAKEFVKIVEESAPGSVIFFSGHSYEVRTKSTLNTYADEAMRLLEDNPDVVCFDRFAIRELASSKKSEDNETVGGFLKTAQFIQQKAEQAPNAKVVINLPLLMNNFGFDKNMSENPDWLALWKKHGDNYDAWSREWLQLFNNPDTKDTMPDPYKMAKDYLDGIKRLQSFVKNFSGDRNVKVIAVGHSFNIDATVTYLANNGEITPEGFEKIGGKSAETTEMVKIDEDEQGELNVTYRGKEFQYVV